jgi:hypothetical protein
MQMLVARVTHKLAVKDRDLADQGLVEYMLSHKQVEQLLVLALP